MQPVTWLETFWAPWLEEMLEHHAAQVWLVPLPAPLGKMLRAPKTRFAQSLQWHSAPFHDHNSNYPLKSVK